MHSKTDRIATDEIVSDYLDNVEHLLKHADTASVAVMAPTELRRTIGALRAILTQHAHDPREGHRSGPIRWAWQRAQHQVRSSRMWQVAYQHLIVAAPVNATGPIDAVGGPR